MEQLIMWFCKHLDLASLVFIELVYLQCLIGIRGEGGICSLPLSSYVCDGLCTLSAGIGLSWRNETPNSSVSGQNCFCWQMCSQILYLSGLGCKFPIILDIFLTPCLASCSKKVKRLMEFGLQMVSKIIKEITQFFTIFDASYYPRSFACYRRVQVYKRQLSL